MESLRDQLKLEGGNLRGMVYTKLGRNTQPPKLAGKTDSLISDIRIMEEHCSDLEALLGESAPQFKFVTTPATQARPASSAHIPPVSSSGAPASKKPTLTEQVLTAKGCKTLAELTARQSGMMAGTDKENQDQVNKQRQGGSGRPDDGDTNEDDRQKEEDAKKSPQEIAREQLGHVREIANAIAPGSGPTLTQKLLAHKGVKTLAQLNAEYVRTNPDAGD